MNNQSRALSSVVAVEAWHEAFTVDRAHADLNVDVVFMTGRMGGEADEEVRFQLGIRRAEVVVVASPTEPVRVDPRTVARDDTTREVTSTETLKAQSAAAIAAGLSASACDLPMPKASVAAEAAASRERRVDIVEALSTMRIVANRNDTGDYQWSLEPAAGETLKGRPWKADERRLVLSDTRRDRARGVEPVVSIEIRCRREDLVISDIRLKEKGEWLSRLTGPSQQNRMKAAEALIRTRLFEQGLLEAVDFGNPYARMTLASVLAQSL